MQMLEIFNFSHMGTGIFLIAVMVIVMYIIFKPKASNCPNKMNVENIDAEEFNKRLSLLKKKRNNVLIDIRTREEFLNGHIDGATNIDIYSKDLKERLAVLDRKKEYFIYCRSGSRTFWAVKTMKKLCFENIFVLKRGFLEWQHKFGNSNK